MEVAENVFREVKGPGKISHLRRKFLKWFKLLFFNVLLL